MTKPATKQPALRERLEAFDVAPRGHQAGLFRRVGKRRFLVANFANEDAAWDAALALVAEAPANDTRPATSCEHTWERRAEQDSPSGWPLRYRCQTCGTWGRVLRGKPTGVPLPYKKGEGPADFAASDAHRMTVSAAARSQATPPVVHGSQRRQDYDSFYEPEPMFRYDSHRWTNAR